MGKYMMRIISVQIDKPYIYLSPTLGSVHFYQEKGGNFYGISRFIEDVKHSPYKFTIIYYINFQKLKKKIPKDLWVLLKLWK